MKQEPQRVAVGPGKAQFISIRQVSADDVARHVRTLLYGPPLLMRQALPLPPPPLLLLILH